VLYRDGYAPFESRFLIPRIRFDKFRDVLTTAVRGGNAETHLAHTRPVIFLDTSDFRIRNVKENVMELTNADVYKNICRIR